MRKIFCFGNEYFKGDEIAKRLAKEIIITDFEFIISESPNDILNAQGELIIMDVVKGLNNVEIIEKIDDLILTNSITCHDLDLGFYIKLMKKIGKINKIKIIGLPFGNDDYEYLQNKVKKILKIL